MQTATLMLTYMRSARLPDDDSPPVNAIEGFHFIMQATMATRPGLARLPEKLGTVSELLADNGYFSKDNVAQCAQASLDPLIALG